MEKLENEDIIMKKYTLYFFNMIVCLVGVIGSVIAMVVNQLFFSNVAIQGSTICIFIGLIISFIHYYVQGNVLIRSIPTKDVNQDVVDNDK